MIRIAVIADTHDRMPDGLIERLAKADEIWHLGDVCEPETLSEFEQPGRPVYAVLGNNESHNLWPLERTLERGGWYFHLVHIPPRRAPEEVDFVLHGHTHVPRDETDERGVRWLNPGSVTGPRQGTMASFAWLTLKPGKAPEWRTERI